MPNKKSFAIYCSGSASRVTKFYSNIKNLNLLSPKKYFMMAIKIKLKMIYLIYLAKNWNFSMLIFYQKN